MEGFAPMDASDVSRDRTRHEPPASRRLRIFAFDPSLAQRLETAGINEITVDVQWEDSLEAGPVGEYIEVVDADPASGVCYRPIILNDPYLLAQDGVAPSESNPQFHQQMVYAVAMTTIRHFERALGRVALWADREVSTAGRPTSQFVRRLRIYPHAIRDRNAYYSPSKKALLFGYFPVTAKDRHNTPGTVVFTCLSHDIIAHETTHALLDGVHPRFSEPSNPDVHAFHEAFADIVALFQHFSYPAVLESQIRRTRGNLSTESLLGQLAQQFGRATGRGAALRDFLGERNKTTGVWELRAPNPKALESTHGPHARGAILVAAVFRAFLLIYRARSEDLFRIASQGTGTLPVGEIHPDLTRRLALEAAGAAERVLQMCIRAIDYCPPVNITFGDFLRGVVTADLEFSPADKTGYRIGFIESFREWGIYPRGISSMGLDTLAWPTGDELSANIREQSQGEPSKRDEPFDTYAAQQSAVQSTFPNRIASIKVFVHKPVELKEQLQRFIPQVIRDWNLESDRREVWNNLDRSRVALWKWLRDGDSYGRDYANLFGLVIDEQEAPPTVYRSTEYGGPSIEVHSVRPSLRRTVDGTVRTDLVIEITQRRRGYFNRAHQFEADDRAVPGAVEKRKKDFIFRSGCTVLIDPRTANVRRIIRTPGTIADNGELERVRRYLVGDNDVVGNAFDAGLARSLSQRSAAARDEPFAMLHQLEEE